MAEDQKITINISYKGVLHNISLPQTSTLRDLKEKCYEFSGILPENQKLLHAAIKKSTIDDRDLNLQSLAIPPDSRILLVGTSVQDKSIIAKNDYTLQVRKERERIGMKHLISPSSSKSTLSTIKSTSQYTFHSFKALPQFTDSHTAVELLQRLSNDHGIKSIMIKYEWSVQLLREIHPNEDAAIL